MVGVRCHQLLEPPDHVPVLPQLEGGGHRGLLGNDAELAEPGDSGIGEVRRAEIAQHVAAPQAEGVVQQRCGAGWIADPERFLAAADEVLDHLGVEVGGLEEQRIPSRAVDEGAAGPGCGQDSAYRRDMGAQGGRCPR